MSRRNSFELCVRAIVRVHCSRLVLFFFSSRRRHTRSLCDWSSDVCSSDLRKCPMGIGLMRAAATMPWYPQAREIQTVTLKMRSEEHTSELQSHSDLVCRLLLEKKKKKNKNIKIQQ